MAITAISEISPTIVRRGHPITKYATLAANTYIPGDWGAYSATGTVTIIDSDTPAHILVKPMLIGFEPRVSSVKARKDIDDAIAISKGPIIWGGETGPLIVAARLEDPGAGPTYRGHAMMASNTGGDIEILDDGKDPTGGAPGPGNIFVWEEAVNTNTVGIFLIY